MKTPMILWAMLLLPLAISAQATKKAPVKKPVSSSKQKPAAGTAAALIPANAFHFKENGKTDVKIDSIYPAIVIEGNNNSITVIEGNVKIFIKGKGNDINMISANYIEISGDNNFVSWEKSENASGKPQVNDKGGYNNVGKKSGKALNKSDN
jgi:hypothetical protein